MKASTNKSMIIVLVGQSGAGKTTIAGAIEYPKIASCTLLRNEVARRGLEDNHESIHAVAMDLISQDPAWQAKKILEIASQCRQPFIFDGPRSPADLQFLLESDRRVEIIGIYSSRAIRYQRVLKREQQPITKEQFMRRCIDEVVEAGLNNCLRLATIQFFNNVDSLKDVRQCAISLMEAILSGNLPHMNFSFHGEMPRFEKFISTSSLLCITPDTYWTP